MTYHPSPKSPLLEAAVVGLALTLVLALLLSHVRLDAEGVTLQRGKQSITFPWLKTEVV